MRKDLLSSIVNVLLSVVLAAGAVVPVANAATIRAITFPVDGEVTFHDDFGEPRSGGRTHEGNDLIGAKMLPLLSAVDGRVRSVVDPEASWGYAITIEDDEGYTYHYLHVNNDTPGTDDGMGGTQYAYAPGIRRGVRVTAGQLIGWMGDSGNAEHVGAHLHFEMRYGGTALNPYESLLAARRQGGFNLSAEIERATDIGTDKGWTGVGSPACAPGSLIKTDLATTVYFCGADGKRHGFPNQRVYMSWYSGFANVAIVTPETLASLPLGRNVTYRPGIRMVKITTDPKVYAVTANGTLRWVTTPELAERLYGTGWAAMVDDVSDALFFDYTVGEPITVIET